MIVAVLLGLFVVVLNGCHLISVNEVSFPTPLGPLVVKVDQIRKVERLSAASLDKVPLGTKNDKLDPGEYRKFFDLRFAVWVPEGCVHDAGSFMALDPGFNPAFQREYEKRRKELLRDYEQLPPKVLLSDLYLQAESVRFKCGPSKMMSIISGSRIAGWKVNEKLLSEFKATGQTTNEYPHREIQVTAVPKSKVIQLGYTPSTANLLVWANEFSLVTDHQRIFTGKDATQLFSLSQATFENIEILNKPRTLKFHVLTGMFEGTSYLYFVHVAAMEGEPTENQWNVLQASLESFRFE